MTAPGFGSLYSGVGGMDLGLDRAGWIPQWQVEINPYRRQVLERHWPDVQRFTDVREVGAELAPVDLIAAGFPCQPFSVAGRNRGEADERNMWPDTIRVIRAVRPRFALLENVPGLLAHSYFGTILGDLAEAGYDAEWFCIRASDFGATHRRKRLFIVADRSKIGWRTRRDIGDMGSTSNQEGHPRNQLAQTTDHRSQDVADSGRPGQNRLQQVGLTERGAAAPVGAEGNDVADAEGAGLARGDGQRNEGQP
ncbi:hypothetical protein LCGC14_1524980, partial [marine sediment metagenome]